jgi:hypothetical protein
VIEGNSNGCPVCGLLNPPSSSWCDCGYDFSTRTGGRRSPLRVRYRSIFWFACFVGCIALIAMTSAIYGLIGVAVVLVVTPHIPLAIAWITWLRSSFAFTPQRARAILLFCGLLVCSLSIIVFWSHVLDNVAATHGGGAENICDVLNTIAVITGIFGKGSARLPLLLAAVACWAMWLPVHFFVL